VVSQLKGGGQAGTATARKRFSVLLGVGRSLPFEDFTSMRFTKLLFDEVHQWMLDSGLVVTHR
jgi:hypothetical protein